VSSTFGLSCEWHNVLVQVPGSFELPFAARTLMHSNDVVICLGCLIKVCCSSLLPRWSFSNNSFELLQGETSHYEYIAEATAQGIMRLNTDHPSLTPVIFGVLACLTEGQALARAGLGPEPSKNHGIEWAESALVMASLKRSALEAAATASG
jgi:6,7-dimethyl-8-ribityllumazine synthase